MEEIRVQPIQLGPVSRTSPDASDQRGRQRSRRERSGRRPPGPAALELHGLTAGEVRVEPVLDRKGRVTKVRLYGERSGKFLGEMSPEELKQFADRHQTHRGLLVERRL